MPKRKILVGDDRDLSIGFLSDFFSETKSIPIFAKSKEDVEEGLSLMNPDLVFMRIDWMDEALGSKLAKYRKDKPQTKFFSLGYSKNEYFKWENQFEVPLELKAFRKTLLGELQFPPLIKLLVIDDEKGIGELFKDFFELRKDPPFQVDFALDGLEGFKKIETFKPDCLILDIKMPIRSGIEVYRDLRKSQRDIPTIIFIDATSADEISEMRKIGNPVFVEKSGSESSMPEMLALIKKMVYFA